jgi:hypothetical protein
LCAVDTIRERWSLQPLLMQARLAEAYKLEVVTGQPEEEVLGLVVKGGGGGGGEPFRVPYTF